MSRTKLLAIAFFAAIPFALTAQQATPQTPEDAFTTRDLIAWSHLQTPQPVPQPLPSDEARAPQPEQPRDQQSRPPADPHSQQQPAFRVIGTVVKDGGEYVLQVAHANYKLEGLTELGAYETRSVMVVGFLNSGSTTIHAVMIQILS